MKDFISKFNLDDWRARAKSFIASRHILSKPGQEESLLGVELDRAYRLGLEEGLKVINLKDPKVGE